MRDLPIVNTAWNFYYVHQYMRSGWELEYAPKDIFGGFGHLLAGRAGEVAEMRHGGGAEREVALGLAPADRRPDPRDAGHARAGGSGGR